MSLLEYFKKNWHRILKTGVAYLIVPLCVSIVATLLASPLTQSRQLLEFEQTSTELISNEIAQISGIAITMDGEPVENLTSTTIKFVNKGSQTIDEADFRKTAPLVLTIVDGHFIGEQYKAISSKSQNLAPEIIPVDNNTLQIAFDCIKSKESFSVTLFHDGVLSVEGELREGTLREQPESSLVRITSYTALFSSIMTQLVVLIPQIASMFKRKRPSTNEEKNESENETIGGIDGNPPEKVEV